MNDTCVHNVKVQIMGIVVVVTEYTPTETVNKFAPTATFSNNGPVDEGSPATVSFTSQSDPSSADTSAGFHYAYACDGGSLAGATYVGSGTTATTQCTYPNGPSDHVVRGRIIDKDGGFTEYTTNVHVNNVAPTVTLTGPTTATEGDLKHYSFTTSDPGTLDTFTVVSEA